MIVRNPVILKRIKAFLVDYLIILAYIILLIGATLVTSRIFQLDLKAVDPLKGELIAFLTLTLPVILYFTFSENSTHGGTIGKIKLRLQVINTSLNKAGTGQLLFRNCLKFLPWELAHFFIYQLYYFNSIKQPVPVWVMTGLIVAQVLAIIYLLGVVFNKNNRAIYEIFSQTKVVSKTI